MFILPCYVNSLTSNNDVIPHLNNYSVLYIYPIPHYHCTLTFFNILTPKISRIPKNNHSYIIHTLGDT